MSNYLHKPPKLLWLGSVKKGEQKVYLTARSPGEVLSSYHMQYDTDIINISYCIPGLGVEQSIIQICTRQSRVHMSICRTSTFTTIISVHYVHTYVLKRRCHQLSDICTLLRLYVTYVIMYSSVADLRFISVSNWLDWSVSQYCDL